MIGSKVERFVEERLVRCPRWLRSEGDRAQVLKVGQLSRSLYKMPRIARAAGRAGFQQADIYNVIYGWKAELLITKELHASRNLTQRLGRKGWSKLYFKAQY